MNEHRRTDFPTDAPTPWTFEGTSPTLGHADGVATLVEGQTFCLSSQSGDILSGCPHGLFVFDTRVLSRMVLTVDGNGVEPLAVDMPAPFQATFIGRLPPAPGHADGNLIVRRRRSIGNGLRDVITVRNVGLQPADVRVDVRYGADFADLFAVKEGRVARREAPAGDCTPTLLTFRQQHDDLSFETAVRLSEPAAVEADRASWHFQLEPRDECNLCIEVSATVDGNGPSLRFRCGQPDELALPAERLTAWRQTAPIVRSDSPALDTAVRRGIEDLGALRIFDPAHTQRPVIAAGAPWFMALFGRDALLTAWMSLLVDPDLAIGVVEALGALQGQDVNPETEEEPGRIMHEARLSPASGFSLHGGSPYYGSIDATPLYVMVVGELCRWGADPAILDPLMPRVDAALEWITSFGDRDGDGYVEYQRTTPQGLANQGWKDSWDGVRFADARMPQTPIALCEVQAYVYAAYRARADLAVARGEPGGWGRWSEKADELREAFNRDFWLPEHGWYALGLDAEKRPIDALASNMGHCLWAGIVDVDRAAAVADRLAGSEMFSGWGIRTLATHMTAYNPVSYHNGSVWPHDTALCAAGLMRYGFVDHADRVIHGLLDASAHGGGRMPELFAGFGRDELGVPAPYPTSCSPQAWASAAPLLMLRTMLRLDPLVQRGQIWMAPVLPEGMRRLHVEGLTVGDRRLAIDIEDDRVEVEGAGSLQIVPHPAPVALSR